MKTVSLPEVAVVAKQPEQEVPNTVVYYKDGKKMYTTSDKMPETFKEEYDQYPDESTRDIVIKNKYKTEYKGTTFLKTPTLKEKVDNFKPRTSAWEQKKGT